MQLIPHRDRSERLPHSEAGMDRGTPQRVQRERAIAILELDGAEVGREDLGAEALRKKNPAPAQPSRLATLPDAPCRPGLRRLRRFLLLRAGLRTICHCRSRHAPAHRARKCHAQHTRFAAT
jgi:hypothetical protein